MPVVIGAAACAGSVPFSYVAARLAAGVDLRDVGNRTVSGTGLFDVAGFGPLAAAGVLEVAKGAVGPLLAGRDRPWLAVMSVAAGIGMHNWSPWLGGAGGRGLSPALGATLVLAPEGTALLLGAMAAGRVVRCSGVATLAAVLGVGPLLAWRRGAWGAGLGVAIAVPMIAKRLAGNAPAPAQHRWRTMWSRLLYDRDS